MRNLDLSFLDRTEEYILRLRSLYEHSGYRRYAPLRFESYDFYARNRDFLVGSSILTFTDLNGKLMALRPDVTLSIVKAIKPGEDVSKLYYHENVYREAHGEKEFRQLSQVGVEVIGEDASLDQNGVIRLASQCLALSSAQSVLLVSHMGLLSGLLDELSNDTQTRGRFLSLVADRNVHELKNLCAGLNVPQDAADALVFTASAKIDSPDTLSKLRIFNDKMQGAVSELTELLRSDIPNMRCDLSVTDDPGYYNGVVMRGYVNGVPRPVLSGGRYDMLMKRMKKSPLCGVGFAIYLNELERLLRQEAKS